MEYGSKEEPLQKYGPSVRLVKARPPEECLKKLYSWMNVLYGLDEILDEESGAQTSSSLWLAAIANLTVQIELMHWLSEGTDLKIPKHVVALTAEFRNLLDGVPSRLLRHDGATMGDNPKDAKRLAFQAYAAVILQLFMDRDGKGSQKAAAEKIAKALTEAGFVPPGRDGRTYTGRTIMGWLRDARGKDNELSTRYNDLRKLFDEKVAKRSAEDLLQDLAENIKRLNYELR